MILSSETKKMSVRHEIKSQLAKLLATEDLVVEHRKVDTACFNVHTRVLTLPLWEKASGTVYDLLVGHEVGHALFTPKEDWTKTVKVPAQIVNVVEDARVEKLMKRKYMGLAKTFYNGYKELHGDDFFQLSDENISEFNLADRVNLYFKIGNFISLDFNPEEQKIIDMIACVETFADVLEASEKLYDYCKQSKKSKDADFPDISNDAKTSNIHGNSDEEVKSSSQSENFDDEQTNNDQNVKDSGEKFDEENRQSSGTENQNTISNSSQDDEEVEVQTMNNLENKIKNLVDTNSAENVYVEVPQVNFDTIVAKNEEIHEEIDKFFFLQQKKYNECQNEGSIFIDPDTQYKEFKNSAQKEVNYLVKEFECKKSAEAYSRASVSRTGVLDTSRLHSYKFNEDLFKKVSVIPDGKNHGLVFVLDWSGSMSEVLMDTCKQLFNLVWFCKKVSIPFEVYAFTNEWKKPQYDYESGKYIAADFPKHYMEREGLLYVNERFSMMNILTSKTQANKLEKQMLNIWRLAYCSRNHYGCKYTYPCRLSLSGTPLNDALISLHQILPKFQQDNKLQKVHCIVLTDGEAPPLPYHVEIKRAWENEVYIGTRHIPYGRSFLRDRKLGTTYLFDCDNYTNFTDILLNNLRDKFTTINFIGIRVLPGREMSRFVNLYHAVSDKQYGVIMNDWKKSKSFTITKSGYHAYFGLSSIALSQDSEFDVKGDATKAQIKSAFVKSLKTKKMNKKVLGEFISLIA